MDAQELNIGDALVSFDATATPKIAARVVHQTAKAVFLMKPPEVDERGFTQWYLAAPFRLSHERVHAWMEEEELRAKEFRGPARWYWTDAQLLSMCDPEDAANEDACDKGLGTRGDRRDVADWIAERDLNWSYIQPLFECHSLQQVLELGLHRTWPGARARLLNVDPRRVVRAVRIYIYSLGEKGALIPARDRQGGAGKEKFSTVPTGREPEFLRADGSAGFVSTSEARTEMAAGWKKYKKKGTSVRVAYNRTLNEHRAASVTQQGGASIVTLRPEGELYSFDQFCRHGPRGEGNLSASEINGGEGPGRRRHHFRQKVQGLRPERVGLVGQTDSSPADFHPVASASRLATLCAPSCSEMTCEELGYTFGIYVGFEHVSTSTALLATLNAAEDKVAFCREWGIEIEPWQWHSRVFKRVKADNGELKSQKGFVALSDMEQTGEFCRAYVGEDKAMQESRHRSRQVAIEHQAVGTNFGRRRERGEADPRHEAALTLREYMQQYIRYVLWKNNEERVEHLLTFEMRNENVPPYRGDIYRWCLRKKYVIAESPDLTALRARCLPTVKAVLRSNGVHLMDPTTSHRRIIRGAVFSSAWLKSSGLLAKAHRRRKTLHAHINPGRLDRIYVELDDQGMRELTLQTNDPLAADLTLAEWLSVNTGDRAYRAEVRHKELCSGASRTKTQDAVNASAKAAKRKELAELPSKPSKRSQIRDMDENTRLERAATSSNYVPDVRDSVQGRLPAQPQCEDTSSVDDTLETLRRMRNGGRS